MSDRKGVLISPIAFVSEHVETLVELDREYAALTTRPADLADPSNPMRSAPPDTG